MRRLQRSPHAVAIGSPAIFAMRLTMFSDISFLLFLMSDITVLEIPIAFAALLSLSKFLVLLNI